MSGTFKDNIIWRIGARDVQEKVYDVLLSMYESAMKPMSELKELWLSTKLDTMLC